MSTALAIAPREESTIAPQPNFGPMDFSSLERWAERISKSGLIPKQYIGRPDDICVAVMYGAELGLPPMQSLNSVCVINGRPGLFGDGFLGVLMSHPAFEGIQEDDLVDIEKSGQATCRMKRRGMPERKVTFTMAMAKTAGLLSKDGPWKTYPSRQLQMRARGFCGRDLFADRLRGVKIAEELYDYPTIDGTFSPVDPATQQLPKPAAQEPVITQDQARDFGKAWKASNYTVEEAKAWLKQAVGVEFSLKIPISRYQEAMTWASTVKPDAASATRAAATPTDAAADAKAAAGKPAAQAAEMSPEEKNCREAFSLLDWDLTKQAKAIDDHKGDWTALFAYLNKRIDEEGL